MRNYYHSIETNKNGLINNQIEDMIKYGHDNQVSYVSCAQITFFYHIIFYTLFFKKKKKKVVFDTHLGHNNLSIYMTNLPL